MALMPGSAVGPFHKTDRLSVIGALKSTGSQDHDILHAQKEQLLAPYKNLRMMAYITMPCGVILTITVFAAILGIPAFLFGLWVYFFAKKNIAVVEGAYAEYLSTLPAQGSRQAAS